jgi:outer membrane protein OmpA-like peptidoglycan-associated protein
MATAETSTLNVTTSNHQPSDNEDEGYADGDKLIPEWRVAADDQVLVAGLAVMAALLLSFAWSIWRDGDVDVATEALDELNAGSNGDDEDEESAAEGAGVIAAAAPSTTISPESTTSTSTTSTSTTSATATVGDVPAAVASLPGDIVAEAEGTTAVLTGFVANDIESREAEDAAAAVEGIESVDNRLVVLEPAVVSALEEAGVKGATAIGIGTEVTVSGTIDREDDRQPTLDAAAAVDGVTSVIDNRLNVSVTADLNQLPQVQFATGSAEILAISNPDLDAAAELLIGAGNDLSIEIQGYTDVRGDEQDNLELSQARADAVRDRLVSSGVAEAVLTAVGFGETEQFGAGNSPEALQANRLVRFQQIG